MASKFLWFSSHQTFYNSSILGTISAEKKWLSTVRFAEALQCLPKRVRRELLEGPSQEIQQTFAAKFEKGLRMKLATPLVR